MNLSQEQQAANDPARLSPNTGPRVRSVSEPGQTASRAVEEVPDTQDDTPELPGHVITCDGCLNDIRRSRPRVVCTECADYDLCMTCYEQRRATKQHKVAHETRHIVRFVPLTQDSQDLVPASETVNPQTSQDRGYHNWTVTSETRTHHLYKGNHARYLASGIPSGHYQATFIIQLSLSPKVTQAHKDQLKAPGAWGKLRLAGGVFASKQAKQRFFRDRFVEDADLAKKLFNEGGGYFDDYVLRPADTTLHASLEHVFHIEVSSGATAEMGFLLQWSGVPSFTNSDEPLLHLSVLKIR